MTTARWTGRAARVVARILAITAPALGISCAAEPKTYDDCILRYVKPGMDKAAVDTLTQSCRSKFLAGNSASSAPSGAERPKPPREPMPPPLPAEGSGPKIRRPPPERDLTPAEVAALTAQANLVGSSSNRFSGTIYNGNSTIDLFELQFNVTTTVDGKEVTRLYRTVTWIPALSSGDFQLDIIAGDKGTRNSWIIAGAKGSLRER